MIEEIRDLVENACKQETNVYGYGAWSHHIALVATYALKLSRQLGGDAEVIELAALLHDYASVINKDYYPEHHLHGARLAEELLLSLNYPREKITLVQQCILSHRSSQRTLRKTLEAKIIADADGLSHFDDVPSLLYLAFVKTGLGIDAGAMWVLEKLKRDWEGLELPESRALAKKKYQAAKVMLTRSFLSC